MTPLATGTTPKCMSAAPASDAHALLWLQTAFSVPPAHFHSAPLSGSDGNLSLCTDLHRDPEKRAIILFKCFCYFVGSSVFIEINLDITLPSKDFKAFIKGAISHLEKTNVSEHPTYFLDLLITKDSYP